LKLNTKPTIWILLSLAIIVLGCELASTKPDPTPTPPATPDASGFTIDFIDVGQGDATLITAITGETLLVDGGRSKKRLRDRLESMGIEDLDAIALTHPDADHVAGLVEVLEMFPIERIYLNGGESESQTFGNFMAGVDAEGATVTTVTRGDTMHLGGLTLKVVHPGKLSGDSNEDSMVLLLDCAEVEVLLTGDAETPSEVEMIAAGVLFDIDVLKIGHHGSRTSSSQAFLDVLLPEAGVISAGMENSYGHPHEDVVARLAATGMHILETDTTENADGIRMTSDCQTYEFGPIP
jgi:beta-lactamase superfamily II metal-dependent hydrolase